MSTKRKIKKKQYIDPYDVLEGRINVTSDELIRLIHQVNPTTMVLGTEKETEHYKIKSRLQSLLIRKFYDKLLVDQPDPGNPTLVSLKLRYFDEDACHALIPDLDPDARSWVKRQIDETLSPGGNETCELHAAERHLLSSGSRSAPEPVYKNETDPGANQKEYSLNELINRGRQALEEYDYVTCEDYFNRAFIMSHGDIEAAQTILDFYVDHLAAYEKALALANSLSINAKKNEETKVLLALAAVRLGDIDRALGFLGSVRHPRSFEVYLLSARHFVTRGNADRAKELLAVLKSFEAEGIQPGIIQLENDIQELRRKNLEPLEQEILLAWQQDDREKAVKMAEELLVEWPQNQIARRICSQFARQQEMVRLNLLLHRADEAHDRSEFITEAELLKEAVALSKTDQGLRERLNRVQQAAKLQRDEAEIAEVLSLLAAGSKKESLLRFAALPGELRREIMTRNQDEYFSQLSLVISEQSSLKPTQMVEAVLALDEAEEIFQKGGDAQIVVSILQRHSKILQFVPAALDLLYRAQEILKTLESARAKERLKKAADLAAAGDFQAVRKCIAEINADHLDEADRKIFAEMNETLKRLESIQALEKSYTSETEPGNHFSRKDIALKLAKLVEPDTDRAAHWREKAAYHSAQIRKECSLVASNIENLPLGCCIEGLLWAADKTYACLLLDGRHIVLVSAHERWVFLRTLCIEEQKFKQAIVFRAPKAMDYPHIQQAGREIWLSGSQGHVITLTLDPPEIISWYDSGDFVKEGYYVKSIYMLPRAGYLWLNTREHGFGGDKEWKVINIEQHQVEWKFMMKGSPIIINTDSGFRIAIQDNVSRSIRVFSEQGKIIDTFSLAAETKVTAAALHPNGSDYVFLTIKTRREPQSLELDNIDGYEEGDDDDDACPLKIEKVPDEAGTCKPFIINNSHGRLWHYIYTSRENGLIFVYFAKSDSKNQTYQLAAFTPGEQGFEMLYQVELPGKFSLVTDEFSQKTAAIDRSTAGFQAVILCPDKPVFVDNTNDLITGLSAPLFSPLLLFNMPTGPLKARVMRLEKYIRALSLSEFDELLRNMTHPDENNLDYIIASIYAADYCFFTDIARDLRIWFHKNYPHHPFVLMQLASMAFLQWKWQEVISLLDGVSLAGLDNGTAGHIYRLLNIALQIKGEYYRVFELSQEVHPPDEAFLEFEPYSTYGHIARMRPKKRRKKIAKKPLLILLNFLETVDVYLLNGEWLEAVSFMEMHNFLSSNDLQVLARFAEAFLHVRVVPGEPRWFCKIAVLANYSQKHRYRFMSYNQVFPPYIETWSEQRLKDTAIRAAQWLDIQPGMEQV
jgi:hypothetical protein